MGGCVSSPSDTTIQKSTISVQEDGSEEASLIYSNNMCMSSKVTLSFECHNLPRMDLASKSDPFIVVYTKKNSGDWTEVGRTEVIANTLNPVFAQKLLVDYYFEEIQYFRCAVYDADVEGDSAKLDLDKQDFCGEAEFKLPDAIHSSKAYKIPLLCKGKEKGELVVKCEQLNKSSGDIAFKLRASNISCKSFLRISSINDKSDIVPVFKSEVSSTGQWKEFSIDVSILCNVDYQRPILLEVFKYRANGNHTLVGCHRTTTEGLLGSVEQTFPLTGGSDNAVTLTVDQCQFYPKSSFLEYVQSGLDLNFMVAIDFTGSNGSPADPSSLHYANPAAYLAGQYNQYERCIVTIGNVIEFYDSDRMFPVYGFGAVVPPSMVVNHCFPLNGNAANPEVPGVQGVIDIYHHALSFVRLSGPTYFTHVIKQANEIAKMIKAGRDKYLILLILTDGTIHDMEETISNIIDGCDLPLSILIVGVGSADFSSMERLDGDEETLSARGREASRDIVQFVPLREVMALPPEKIAQQLLAEVPRQVTSYMKKEGIFPAEIQQRRSATLATPVVPVH